MRPSLRISACLAIAPISFSAAPAQPLDGGTITRSSVSTSGMDGPNPSGLGSIRAMDITPDGHYSVFTSDVESLVSGDTNQRRDVFRRDEVAGVTIRISVGDQGQQGNQNCSDVSISDDGRFVAFTSESTNLQAGEVNTVSDVFLWDALAGTSTRVSSTPMGVSGNGASRAPSISSDGGIVVFESFASDLVAGDTAGQRDIFAWDRITGLTTLVSAGPGGQFPNGNSASPSISGDGLFAAYTSNASNIAGGLNNISDIFVADLVTGTTILVEGSQGPFTGSSLDPVLSADGRWLAFTGLAANVVPGDTNSKPDIFHMDLLTGTIQRVSESTDGVQGNDESLYPDISRDGQWVAFQSSSSTLVPGDTAGFFDVFIHEVQNGWTERISLAMDGSELSAHSRHPAISGDGRFTVFHSQGTNLVANDTNLMIDVFRHDRGYGTGFAGGSYCGSTPNSSGATASTTVAGSPILAQQNLTLGTVALPLNQLGYYILSQTQANIPGFSGSEGVLCLGGIIVRLNAFVLNSGASGTVDLPLPFGSLPPAANLMSGETWNFQFWFRDVVATQNTSNTSNAVCVTFL